MRARVRSQTISRAPTPSEIREIAEGTGPAPGTRNLPGDLAFGVRSMTSLNVIGSAVVMPCESGDFARRRSPLPKFR